MNNTSTYTYSFSTIKDEFYNDFKGKTIKNKENACLQKKTVYIPS